MIILATEAATDWGAIAIQALITFGVVFGGAGFWEFIKTKYQAKREDKKEETNTEAKFDNLSNQMTALSSQFGNISDNLKEIKQDIILLQEANEATVKYRELRDKNDKEALKAQQAVIESLRGLLRDRLLEVYKQCISKGYYTKEERETYGELFNCYESEPFSGNGVMHQLRPIVQALPWTEEDARKLNSEN